MKTGGSDPFPAVGGLTRWAMTRRQSSPSNRASNCARPSRITPSLRLRPGEEAALQAPGDQRQSKAVPNQDLQPVAALRTEHHRQPRMRIETEFVLYRRGESIMPPRRSTGRIAIAIAMRRPSTIMPALLRSPDTISTKRAPPDARPGSPRQADCDAIHHDLSTLRLPDRSRRRAARPLDLQRRETRRLGRSIPLGREGQAPLARRPAPGRQLRRGQPMTTGDIHDTGVRRQALKNNLRFDLVRPVPPTPGLLERLGTPNKPVLHFTLRSTTGVKRPASISAELTATMGKSPHLRLIRIALRPHVGSPQCAALTKHKTVIRLRAVWESA